VKTVCATTITIIYKWTVRLFRHWYLGLVLRSKSRAWYPPLWPPGKRDRHDEVEFWSVDRYWISCDSDTAPLSLSSFLVPHTWIFGLPKDNILLWSVCRTWSCFIENNEINSIHISYDITHNQNQINFTRDLLILHCGPLRWEKSI